MKKVFVAGHRGLVGSALVRAIGGREGLGWIGEGREGLNLLNREDVFRYINTQKPDAVIVAAAKVGGIGANNAFPVEFLSENLQIMTNLLDACHQANIERVVYHRVFIQEWQISRYVKKNFLLANLNLQTTRMHSQKYPASNWFRPIANSMDETGFP